MVFLNTDHYWAKTLSMLPYQKNVADVFGSTFIPMSFQSNAPINVNPVGGGGGECGQGAGI